MDDDGAESPESLSEWEQVEYPLHQTPPPPLQHSISHQHMENKNQIHLDHSRDPNSPSSSSSSSSPTPPPAPPSPSYSTNLKPDEEEEAQPRSESRLVVVKEMGKRLRLRFGSLRDEVLGAASKVCSYKLIAGRFRSIASVAGVVAALLLSLLYAKLWRPRWRPRVRDDKERLLLLLREKDEKISQLLVQIAQMNEALSARRRVPVIRVG